MLTRFYRVSSFVYMVSVFSDMASTRVLLPGMPSNSKFHEVRVKIVSKTPPTQNPGKMCYQAVVMRDEAVGCMICGCLLILMAS